MKDASVKPERDSPPSLFHGGNTGLNPVRVANLKSHYAIINIQVHGLFVLMHRHVYRRIGTPLKLAAIGSTSVIFGSSLAAKRASLHRLKRILFDAISSSPEHGLSNTRHGQAHRRTSQQRSWHRLRGQNIEILEPPKIEARAFLQFGQRHLIHRKLARIERRFRRRKERLIPLIVSQLRLIVPRLAPAFHAIAHRRLQGLAVKLEQPQLFVQAGRRITTGQTPGFTISSTIRVRKPLVRNRRSNQAFQTSAVSGSSLSSARASRQDG